MTPEESNAFWTRRFPECPPVGYLFKHLYKDRCARFRLPQDAPDLQHTLLNALFDTDSRVLLITTIPSELETPPRDAPAFLNFDPHGRFMQSLGMHEFELEFDTPSFWHLFASDHAYAPTAFDAVLRESTRNPGEGGVVNTVIAGVDSGRALYAYAGGADAVLEDSAARDAMRALLSEWSV